MKIAINVIYGGFSLSQIALYELNKVKTQKYTNDNINTIERNDVDLINVIETLGEDIASASGEFDGWLEESKIEIIELPDGVKWKIIEDDGIEWVEENHA